MKPIRRFKWNRRRLLQLLDFIHQDGNYGSMLLEAGQKQHSRTQRQHTIILEAVVKDIQKLKYPPAMRAIGFVVRSPKKR